MESELSPDKEKQIPPVPLKTYQWEDLRRARDAGGYPWTHILKVPLDGEITAEDIIRETTPHRSMSREFSRSRTRSPVGQDEQKILNLDSSPGSSRRHGEEGEDEGVHIPNFSKEASLDSEDDAINKALHSYVGQRPVSQASTHLNTPVELNVKVSPKSILKRRVPDQVQYIGVSESRGKTKCCHPLVNKIKHLAEQTLHKLDKSDNEKSPNSKRKKNDEPQEIRQLKSSPSAVKRQKFSAIKLGDSDEMSKTMSVDTPPTRQKKEHIYEDIDTEKTLHFSPEVEQNDVKKLKDESQSISDKESLFERKSLISQDPSLVADDNISLKPEDHIMEKLHKIDDVNINKEAVLLDDEIDLDEPNVDEIFQNQLEETRQKNESPNITITEIIDEDIELTIEQTTTVPIESSPSPVPRKSEDNRVNVEFLDNEWSKPSSDHEYEIIEKPPANLVYTSPRIDVKPSTYKADDELSSTTSLERKYLQHTSDEEEQDEEKENFHDDNKVGILNAEALQKDIEDRYFVNTPSPVSRTECDVSTSQVDSSALENLPLQRGSRPKNAESSDSKIQQRIKDGAGKIRTQAGRLKTKIQNIKMPDKPKLSMPDRPKFKMPDRPKFSFPDRPKFTLPDRRKFSLPDRPKFKKINISEKLSLGDRKKFTLPDRPKFNMPELPKFKRPDISFPSLGRSKQYKVETTESADVNNEASVEFEAKTYPRLFNRKKKSEIPKTTSSPTLNRDDTPPPTFTFTRVKKTKEQSSSYIPDSPEQPREYGSLDNETNYENEMGERKHFSTTYDFDKMPSEYMDDEVEQLRNNQHSASDIAPSKQEYTHVINEINNDEFFVRPRGISRENIQVREYLSDEIRQAFKIPKNVLALMGSDTGINDKQLYDNEPEADPELMIDDINQMRYSSEDLNDKDDGYYTFPPVRPSRAKRNKKNPESGTMQYIDDSTHDSMQFSEVDLEQQENEFQFNDEIDRTREADFDHCEEHEFNHVNDLHAIHEYANDDVLDYQPILSQTLPMPPKRKKKLGNQDLKHCSLTDFKKISKNELWDQNCEQTEDIIVYRTEHEYNVPQPENVMTEQSPVPPRRNRSRSSRGTSLCDDDRTSHGAESLTLDTQLPQTEDIEVDRIRNESPGYATVDKNPAKQVRRSKSKTPPVRRRKSNSSERKYYTVGAKPTVPDRPPRKKSSTSLMTLDSLTKRSISGDLTQYVEIDEPQFEEPPKDLKSGEVVSKMKDRPLPPPPRPPRGPKRKKSKSQSTDQTDTVVMSEDFTTYSEGLARSDDVVEIEVSTQTDPLPDDVDFELGLDDNLDISMTSSLRDIVDEESLISKVHKPNMESPLVSRPTSRSEKSFKFSDPKISELSKPNIGRTSPTVILVERRVSSPTRINEREEMLTEASLTVQHIDIDESQIPDVPPLPKARGISKTVLSTKTEVPSGDDRALERVSDASRDIQLDNLVTQRLQVRDLDVGRLNVSELQASKILVSDIEGMTLQVTELDSKSGHISVSGIEFSQSVIDEIVRKFAEISTTAASTHPPQTQEPVDHARPMSREEHTQTEKATEITETTEIKTVDENQVLPPRQVDEPAPPQRPPLPDLTPLLYSFLQDIGTPPASLYHPRAIRERPFTEFHESQHQTPPPPTRRAKRKPTAPHSESSSDDSRPRPSPRRMPAPVKAHEPSISEAGAQFFRVCQNSISRTLRNIFNSFMSYISGNEDKKDVQMALVIFLVLIAGLIMFGLSDSRTIHHHHWEFFNPPDAKP